MNAIDYYLNSRLLQQRQRLHRLELLHPSLLHPIGDDGYINHKNENNRNHYSMMDMKYQGSNYDQDPENQIQQQQQAKKFETNGVMKRNETNQCNKRGSRKKGRYSINRNSSIILIAISTTVAIVSFITTRTAQKIAISIVSYAIANTVLDNIMFEEDDNNKKGQGVTSNDEDDEQKKKKRIYFKRIHRKERSTTSSSKTTTIEPFGDTQQNHEQLNGDNNHKKLNSESVVSSSSSWLQQSLDNLEETDRVISELKQKEAEARAAEQKAKAKMWVKETLRSTADAKTKADLTRKQEEEARRKAQKWAESITRQSGIDLNN